jgi:uncharacterized glyoxalase superfamily protein PhnB
MSVNPIPDGYHTVTPYLVVEDMVKLIDFLKAAFDAEVVEKITLPEGKHIHAAIKIGDSIIMMGSASENFSPLYSMIHIYTPDVDQVYQKAISAGATPVMEPSDQYYGDRSAGVKGPMGNYWWIATHIEDISSEEMTRRAIERSKNR